MDTILLGKTTLQRLPYSVRNAFSYQSHICFSDQTPPGTKVKVLRDVAFKSKALIFSKDSLENLGGHVKHLVEGWKVGKDLDRSHNVWGAPLAKLEDSPAGPPRWKPFDFKHGPIKLPVRPGCLTTAIGKLDVDVFASLKAGI
jgi:hypothetical protein